MLFRSELMSRTNCETACGQFVLSFNISFNSYSTKGNEPSVIKEWTASKKDGTHDDPVGQQEGDTSQPQAIFEGIVLHFWKMS